MTEPRSMTGVLSISGNNVSFKASASVSSLESTEATKGASKVVWTTELLEEVAVLKFDVDLSWAAISRKLAAKGIGVSEDALKQKKHNLFSIFNKTGTCGVARFDAYFRNGPIVVSTEELIAQNYQQKLLIEDLHCQVATLTERLAAQDRASEGKKP
jgi:hypothetical protein